MTLQKTQPKVGKIYESKSMFLRTHVGDAKTGKWFLLDWQAICDLAIEAGIDNTELIEVSK